MEKSNYSPLLNYALSQTAKLGLVTIFFDLMNVGCVL